MPIPQDCFPEYLTEANAPSCFDCGDIELNGFLLDDALKHQTTHIAQTILIRTEESIVGYCSLCADALRAKEAQPLSLKKRIKGQCGKNYPSWPALKIGRLGVCLDRQRQGIGDAMLVYVLGLAEKLEQYLAIRFISVDAYVSSEDFYSRVGFVRHAPQPDDEGHQTVSMRLDLFEYWEQRRELPLE